jgi:hypothetical protein
LCQKEEDLIRRPCQQRTILWAMAEMADKSS